MTRLDPEKARQGKSGLPVLYILIAALVLCIIVFFGLGLYGRILPDNTLPGSGSGSGTGAVTTAPAASTAPGATGGVVTPQANTTNPPANTAN